MATFAQKLFGSDSSGGWPASNYNISDWVIEFTNSWQAVTNQPTNCVGIIINWASTGSAVGNGTLAFTAAGQTATWAENGDTAGASVAIGAGGRFTLLSTSGKSIEVTVTAASLPVADASDADITVAGIAGAPNNGTIPIQQKNYLHGSSRYLNSYADYVIHDYDNGGTHELQYFATKSEFYFNIFQDPNNATYVHNAYLANGATPQYPVTNFVAYMNALGTSTPLIHINAYTQLPSELQASINDWMAQLPAGYPAYFCAGNENDGDYYHKLANGVSPYPTYQLLASEIATPTVSAANAPGCFARLTGADSTRALALYPDGLYNAVTYAKNIDSVYATSKATYPTAKFGIPWSTRTVGRVTVDYTKSSNEYVNAQWAYYIQQNTTLMANLDFIDSHLYLHMTYNEVVYLDANFTLPADGMLNSLGMTRMKELCYRYIMAGAQYILPDYFVVKDAAGWPLSVKAVIAEWGLKSYTIDPDATLAAGSETTTNNPQNYMMFLFVLSYFITICEQYIARTDLEITCLHTNFRGETWGNPFYTSGFLNANGLASVMMAKMVEGMTSFTALDLGITDTYLGSGNWDGKAVNAIRAVQFTDGTTTKVLVINTSPNSYTVTMPFTSCDYYKVATPGSDVWALVPDSTYTAIDSNARDQTSGSTMTLEPLSAYYVTENKIVFAGANDYE